MECRATTTVLHIGEIRRPRSFLSCDPLNPEHEAIGQVHWVKSTICVKYLTLHSGAKTLELYEIILTSFEIICDIL
jgi:hypothetical protein